MIAERDWLSPKEVALMKGVTEQAVTQACRQGRLPARNLDGTRWLIHRNDALVWKPRKPRKQEGEPPP